MPETPSFDVREIPFSTRGAWLNLSPVIGLHTASTDIHLVSHQTGMHAVLAILPHRGSAPISADVSASAARLRWNCEGGGHIEAAFEDTSSVRLRGDGVGVVLRDATAALTPFTGTYLIEDPMDRSAVFTSYETGRRYRVTPISGDIRIDGAERLGTGVREVAIDTDQGSWEIVIEEYEVARPSFAASTTFDDVVAASEAAFAEYCDALAPWRSGRTPAAALAAYVIWSATVEPRGFLQRESILMSKHWMDKVWSWDHSFNALALAPGLPEAAIDQFLIVFDHRDESGAAPDSTAHSEILYNFVKPPIHGWAFAKLRERLGDLDTATLLTVYDVLSRWSTFWLDARTAPGRNLPHYQHGNDSGWDNSTTFDRDRVIESPELAAFLIVQLDVLAGLATELGRPTESESWRVASDRIRTALLDELWVDDRFVAVAPLSGRTSTTTSLLNLLAIAAGDRLPADVAAAVAVSIEEHLTEFGPATELVDSPHYEADGYWRGPIWAPSTVLVEDGLRRAGFTELADTISARFRALCEKSGFAENFDALTGKGLRDRAYTWTASAYLLLASEEAARRDG